MPRWAKFLIGLAASLGAGWLHYGPLGGGERFVDALEARAKLRLRAADIAGIQVRMQREPLARIAILSGDANDFQRKGIGSFPGIDDRVGTIPGMAEVRWEPRTCCAEGR